MANAVAGLKRSYHEMIGAMPGTRHQVSDRASLSPSPPYESSRASSRNKNSRNGDVSTAFSVSPRRVAFEPLASIVLVGVRGVGKSTLGILAATAYSRRLVDSERAFVEATGETASTYRKTKGTNDYRRRHNEVLQAMLNDNSSGSVIVCTFSDLEGNGAAILRTYAQTHPVVHITRDADGVKSVLRVWTAERVNDLLSTSAPLLRSCTNYEFFNLTEHQYQDGTFSNGTHIEGELAKDSFLTLKRVERDFLRLLRNVIGDHDRSQAHHSAYPFSQVDLEQRDYTFAVKLEMEEVLQRNLDFDETQIGADCVELSVSPVYASKRQHFNDISKSFAIIRRASILPIMISINEKYMPRHQGTGLDIVEFLLRLGPELATMSLSLSNAELTHLVQTKGFTKIIGRADMSDRPAEGWNDPSCLEVYTRATTLGCDLVKITMPADTVDDVSAAGEFQSRIQKSDVKPKLIAYGTGTKGRPSRCFNKTLTSVRQHQTSSQTQSQNLSKAKLSAKEITKALFATFVFEPMRFFIFGGDVSYSLSPAMHNAAYKECGMRYTFETISSDNIELLKAETTRYDFGGAAVVQPYKTIAFGLMDALSPHAEAIGAVNTVIPIREMAQDGSTPDELEILSRRSQQGAVKALYGFNTDWIGIRACIRRGLSPANTIRPHSTALVCGAGGMARSAVYSLISLGVRHIFVCNRTLKNATTLADHYNELIVQRQLSVLSTDDGIETHVQVIDSFTDDWPTASRQPAVIVCCIPRRTVDNAPTNFTLPEAWLKSPTGGVVLEVAYRQPSSPVEHQIKERAQAGWIFMDGYDVLPEQAFSQFELFTGRRAPRKLMRDECNKHAHS